MRYTISYILIISSLTLLTACGPGGANSSLEQSIETIDARTFSEQVLAQDRPYTLVSLYRSDCPLCSEQLPGLIKLQKQEKSDVSLMLVSLDEGLSKSEIEAFLTNYDVNFSTYHLSAKDARDFVGSRYPQWDGGTPLNMVFTQDGALVEVTGMTDPKEVRLIVHEHQTFK